MHRMKWLSLLLAFALVLGGQVQPVSAQDYSFAVPRADVVATVNADGTVTVEYTYVFENQPGAHEIDFVDIGVPLNASYSLSDMSADVDGQPITDIEESDYVANAIAFGLGSNAIQGGQTGTVHVTMANLRNLVFPGTEEEAEPYASINFMPNFFDPSLVQGKTDMAVTLVLPPGLKQEEPRYYPPQGWPGEDAPGSGQMDDGSVFYTWESTEADAGRQYEFGAAFPARLVPMTAVVEEIPESRPPTGTGTINLDAVFNVLCCLGFAGVFGAVIYFSYKSSQKRKLQYLPPKVAVEGHGIKRGLTAVEVAILMEQPMDKILTMILFAVLRKEAAEVVTREPLKLTVDDPVPSGMQTYELQFLEAFKTEDKVKRRTLLQDVMVELVKTVTQKMKGFSTKETIAYYDDIMKKAWLQVENANTPDVKAEKFEEVMPWTMLDKNFEDRTTQTFSSGPVFVPNWWWRYDPSVRPHMGPSATIPASTGGGGSIGSGGGSNTVQLPNLPGGNFASSMVQGIQTFSAGVIGNINDFTGNITNRTNPLPKPTSTYRGGGGGGGHSCACACACAGCACACAGGGR